MAYNLTRELQMQTWERRWGSTPKRRNLRSFETLGVLRSRLLRRAGRPTFFTSGNGQVRSDLQYYRSP